MCHGIVVPCSFRSDHARLSARDPSHSRATRTRAQRTTYGLQNSLASGCGVRAKKACILKLHGASKVFKLQNFTSSNLLTAAKPRAEGIVQPVWTVEGAGTVRTRRLDCPHEFDPRRISCRLLRSRAPAASWPPVWLPPPPSPATVYRADLQGWPGR